MAIRSIKILMTNKTVGTTPMASYPVDDGNFYEMPTYKLVVSGKDDAGKDQSKEFEAVRFGIHGRKVGGKLKVSVVGLADQQTHTIKRWLPTYSVHSAPSDEDGAWQVYKNFLIHDGPDDTTKDVFGSIGCIEVAGKKGFVAINDFLISLSGSTKPDRTKKLTEMGTSGQMKITYDRAKRPPLKVWGS